MKNKVSADSTSLIIGAGIKAVVWDLDGTLLDSFEIYCNILAEAVLLHNLPMPERQVLFNNFHGTLQDSIAAALSLQDEKSLAKLVTGFLKIQENFYKDPNDHLFSDAFDLAKRLHASGRQQFIVTNRAHAERGRASPRYIVEHSLLQPYIKDLVCRDESQFSKPNSQVLLPMLQRHNLTPQEVLVIGDQHVDAELAHNCGALAVIINRTGQSLSQLRPQVGLSVTSSLENVVVA